MCDTTPFYSQDLRLCKVHALLPLTREPMADRAGLAKEEKDVDAASSMRIQRDVATCVAQEMTVLEMR